MASLPDHVVCLLWDVDPALVDFDREGDRNLVFERVMSRGTRESMTWLRASFDIAVLRAFVVTHGARKLPPRDLAYWAVICDVSVEPEVGGGRPVWAGR